MANASYLNPLVLILTFGDISTMVYLYCVLTLIGYMLIVICNGTVIYVVVLHKTLQEPMYIFISALCVNGLYGSTTYFPSLFSNLLYQINTISYGACLMQAFCLNSYVITEISMLTVMACDRYVCICNPLRYNTIMSLSMVYKLIAASWLYSLTVTAILVLLTLRLPLCGSVILKNYCDNWSVVRLSCIDTTLNNIVGLSISFLTEFVMSVLILFSYISILRVCSKASQEVIAKALQTCTPQLITTIYFIIDVLFEIFFYRYIPPNVPYQARVFMSTYGLVVPFILNPLIYGLKLTKMRIKIFQLFHLNRISAQK